MKGEENVTDRTPVREKEGLELIARHREAKERSGQPVMIHVQGVGNSKEDPMTEKTAEMEEMSEGTDAGIRAMDAGITGIAEEILEKMTELLLPHLLFQNKNRAETRRKIRRRIIRNKRIARANSAAEERAEIRRLRR